MMRRGKPRVSVIVPVYNGADHIGKCLRETLRQTIADFEIICVDDCSKDKSVQVIQDVASFDTRVRLVSMPQNGGPGAARNAGIDAAQGEFITFLDSDDHYDDPLYLERLYRAAKSAGTQVAASSFRNEFPFGKVEDDFSDEPMFAGYTFTQSEVIPYSSYQFDYGFHRFLFAACLFEYGQNRFPKLRFYEDPVFLVRILSQAGRISAVSNAFYCYSCSYKKVRWTTEKALDLLEGVRRNLAFSLENDLPLLHWYTIHHLELEAYGIPVGVSGKLDCDKIDSRLAAIERLMDKSVLARYGMLEWDGTFGLRKKLLAAQDQKGLSVIAKKAEHGLRQSKAWHSLRTIIKK